MKQYVVLLIVVLAGIVPFSSRAVSMDEPAYLQIAQAARTDWLVPAHAPVGEYYLAFLYSILGEFREVPFRLLWSIFPLAAAFAFYELAKRFTTNPLLVAVLFAVSPAFFVYSPTLMMHIPAAAFLLTGFALYFRYAQGQPKLLPVVSLCFVLAAGTAYVALGPLACFGLGLLAARRPAKELLAVAAAPIAIGLWIAAISIHFGDFQYEASAGSTLRNMLATLSFLGAVVICPWAIEGGRRMLVLGSIGTASALTVFASWPSAGYRIWYIMLAASGLAILARFTAAARQLIATGKNSGEGFLLLWAPATLLLLVVFAGRISAHHILLSVPPLLLMLFREAGRRRLAFTVIATAILSVSLAYADFTFVNSYRHWVDRTVPQLQQQGFRVWSGAESGLRFYLEQKGSGSLATEDQSASAGDLIVRQELFRYTLSLERVMTVLKTFTLSSEFPVRTYNAASAAGLHDSNVGLVPFIVSRARFDTIEVSQVNPLPGAVSSPTGPILKQTEAEREFPMKIPSNTKIEYDLDGGDGAVAVTRSGLRLIKGPSPVIVWRNFRIVPKQFAVQ